MRIDITQVAPGAVETMLGLEKYVRRSGLDPSLLAFAVRSGPISHKRGRVA